MANLNDYSELFSNSQGILIMFGPRHKIVYVVAFVYVFQYIRMSGAKSGGYHVNVTRRKDGDIFTRFISNNNSSCESWHAENFQQPFSKENCTIMCKCASVSRTYNIRLGRCANGDDILKAESCNGSVRSTFEPLYDMSKQGKALLNISFGNNQSLDCNISTVQYFNGTREIALTDKSIFFNISNVLVNGSIWLTWNPNNRSPILSQPAHSGHLLSVHLQCSDQMTSPPQRSCFVIKTRGEIVQKISSINNHNGLICVQSRHKNRANVMLLYILVGVGCGLVVIAVVVACFACFKRRRRLAMATTRRVASRSSSRSTTNGGRKPFKMRSSAKNNEPTTPAIHDVIFNELSWDGDGGFSNRALADQKGLEVDYGIPVDFGTLPRFESATSIDSNRNSISPLTDAGGVRHA